jgi:DNA-binding NarL/FixJ family response regulator
MTQTDLQGTRAPIRVLIAMPYTLPRTAFGALIDSCPDMAVVAQATDLQGTVDLAKSQRPDVVVMSLFLPGEPAELAAVTYFRTCPELCDIRVVVLTATGSDDRVLSLVRAGVNGLLDERVSADVLLTCVRAVAGGQALFSPAATRTLIDRILHETIPAAPFHDLTRLTSREREVLALLAKGRSDKEVASALHLSRLTVRSHVQNVMDKLNAHTRAKLVAIAYESGLVRPGTPIA